MNSRGLTGSKTNVRTDNNNLNKNLERKNSTPLVGITNKPKILKEINNSKDSKINETSDYVVYKNPNHNILPDYQVLKNNSTKNAKAQLRINKNHEEESIFNLGKPQNKLPNQYTHDNENISAGYASDEGNFGNEIHEGIYKYKF